MSYRCRVCNVSSKPGKPMLRHVTYRPDGQIESEAPVCAGCLKELTEAKTTPDELLSERQAEAVYQPKPVFLGKKKGGQ